MPILGDIPLTFIKYSIDPIVRLPLLQVGVLPPLRFGGGRVHPSPLRVPFGISGFGDTLHRRLSSPKTRCSTLVERVHFKTIDMAAPKRPLGGKLLKQVFFIPFELCIINMSIKTVFLY